MGPAGRFALMAELSDEVIAMAHQAIAQTHPALDGVEIRVRFIEQNYGLALAQAVRRRLQER
jgi:hypothetical protein